MTRCTCCNAPLSDKEATLKHNDTQDYLDMCTECINDIQDSNADIVLTTELHTFGIEEVYNDDNDYVQSVDDLTDYSSITYTS